MKHLVQYDLIRNRTIEAIVPDDSDAALCPEGCGGFTDDPYGGPCMACWREVDRREREETWW